MVLLLISNRSNTKHPIFIIGSGRCGSTLFHKILSSHRDLIGFPRRSEQSLAPPFIPHLMKKKVDILPFIRDPKKFTKISISNWPKNHSRHIAATFNGFHLIKGIRKTPFVKSSMISFMIEEILSIYPKAKFIHIYRNGPSVIESFIKKEWNKYRRFFCSADEYRFYCAKYWTNCILEIENQNNKLSLDKNRKLFQFSYENLCEYPNHTINDLSEYLSVSSNRFEFDLNDIVSTNYKVGDYRAKQKWKNLRDIINPGMELKGYSLL